MFSVMREGYQPAVISTTPESYNDPMNRVATLSLLCTLALSPTALPAQAGPQLGTQTGTQLGVQTPAQPMPGTGQQPPHGTVLTPMPMPVISQGMMELLKLESDFCEAVAKGGGRAFASWFADDGVTLNNGQAPVLGRRNIAAITTWDPKTYQLSWYVEGAQMMPSNDNGFTWGHYDATTVDPKTGKSSTASGRYFTFWKKVDGKWKVALDASANEPAVLPDLPAPPPSANTPPR